MNHITFIIGGCRSGKSRHALEMANAVGSRRRFFATCMPGDDEMRDRIAAHRQERGNGWTTVEAPYDLAAAVRSNCADVDAILIDCLTLWTSNRLLKNSDPEKLARHVDDLLQAFRLPTCPVFIVSNEVGGGIVPENRLARLFRDCVGMINQKVAATADTVVWTVAGIPVTIKNGKESAN